MFVYGILKQLNSTLRLKWLDTEMCVKIVSKILLNISRFIYPLCVCVCVKKFFDFLNSVKKWNEKKKGQEEDRRS